MDTLPSRFNLIGAGRVGQTLARRWHEAGVFQLGGVVTRRADRAAKAAAFIGAGQPSTLAQLPAASVTLIATDDGRLAEVAAVLAATRADWQGCTVFHVSGALPAAVLLPLQARGAAIASAHPAMSFADPAHAVGQFDGTPVALEGDAAACALLHSAFAAIGGQPFALAAGAKTHYHAALSMASNYLVTLTALAESTLGEAGLSPVEARALLAPLMRQSLDNALTLSPAVALTGPIVRGDAQTVAAHLAALLEPTRSLYRALGRATLTLAADSPYPAERAAVATVLEAVYDLRD